MDDSINRQAAINVVRDVMLDFIEYEDEIEVPMADTDKRLFSIKKAISKRIKALPSAQPERRKGRWINDVAYYDEEGCPCIVTRCDQCGEPGTGNYCSYCGADMRGD